MTRPTKNLGSRTRLGEGAGDRLAVEGARDLPADNDLLGKVSVRRKSGRRQNIALMERTGSSKGKENNTNDEKPKAATSLLGEHIGRELRGLYEDVVAQPVPDHFMELLNKLEAGTIYEEEGNHASPSSDSLPAETPLASQSGARWDDPLLPSMNLGDKDLETLWLVDPEKAFELAMGSLSRSAAMMDEIVEETRRDQIEFEIRGRQIDRTLARTQEILDALIAEPR